MANYNEVTPKPLGRKDKANLQAAWPPSLQRFVDNCFELAESLLPQQKTIFNNQMQTLMALALAQNAIWTNAWDQQTLPVFGGPREVALVLQQPVQPVVTRPVEPVPSVAKRAPDLAASYDSKERKRQRMARFGDTTRAKLLSPAPGSTKEILGTLQALEKRYLRLTSEPDPANVRPAAVLKKALEHVVQKFRDQKLPYLYINDQLKAIRQDLTVQHIKDDLAISVYEAHGRIAIENDDLGEFNQCLAQLDHLYALKKLPAFFKHTYEFMCYRILYLLLTGNHAGINLWRERLLKEEPKTTEGGQQKHVVAREGVRRALDLLTNVAIGDYHSFFRTYRWFSEEPAMKLASHMLAQFMATKQRLIALNTMCHAYKRLPLYFLQGEFAFPDTPALLAFFKDYGLSLYATETDFDLAAARPYAQRIVDNGTFKKVDIKGQV